MKTACLVICSLISACYQNKNETLRAGSNKNEFATATKKINQPAFNNLGIDSTYPCQLSKPDTSIFDIILNEPNSSIKKIGKQNHLKETDNDFPCVRFSNQDKTESLTLFLFYGSGENEFSEFEVKKWYPLDSATETTSDQFISGYGIRLGMTKKDVISILGNCFKASTSVTGTEILEYHLDNFNESDFLQRFNMPSYHAKYEFSKGKLIHFRFGFEYP